MARYRRWLRPFLRGCLIAAVVGWLATSAAASTADAYPAPTGLTATATSNSQITLSWTAPDSGSLIGYNIYEGTSPGGESPAGSSTTTPDMVTGLASGTTYYFEVTAVYADCEECSHVESPRSNEVSATTGWPVPGAPTGLTATAEGSSQVTLSWTVPTSPADVPVTSYKIYDGTSPGAESPAGNSTATSDVLTGLASGTTYYFEVTAVNSGGQSARSNEASATTAALVAGTQPQTIHFGKPFRHPVRARFTLSASASSGLPVSFGSDTPGVCSVSGSVVTTDKRGRCTITASQDGNASYAPAPPVRRSFRVGRVRGRPQAITFLRPAGAAPGQPVRLSASASSGLPVSFGSDTPGVCSVSGSVVTTVKRGRCTITASQRGNASYAPAPPVTQSFEITAATPWLLRALAIMLAVAALAATVTTGWLLARQRRLQSRHLSGPSVRAEPHAGQPGPVHIRTTGTDVTSTVRIEPHPASVSSRLEGPSHER